MAANKQLNSKTQLLQPTAGDRPNNPYKVITQRMPMQTSSAGQSIITLPFAVDQNIKDSFLLIIDGKVLTEGSGNDYTWTSIATNNTSTQITLTSALIAGLGITGIYLGIAVQQEPNVNTLAATIAALSGTGSGSGGINYVTAYNAESSITGWARYQNTAQANPVTGSGGSPSSSVTFAQSTSSPLRGTASFLLTKDAQNRQGEGVSYDFAIDAADKAQMLSIKLDLAASSGLVLGADVAVWIYDKDAGQLIQPAPYLISDPAKFQAAFQTSASSTNYRLIFQIATTNTAAWTLKLDNIQVGPQNVARGCPVSDWVAFTPTLNTNTAVASNIAFWRRVGDSIEVMGSVLYNAGGPNQTWNTYLPPGLTVNESKMQLTSLTYDDVGGASYTQGGAATFSNAYVNYTAGNTNFVSLIRQDSSGARLNNNILVANDSVNYSYKLPITGWSSNVVFSQDGDTRVCAMKANGATGTINSSANLAKYTTVENDTHGAYSPSTGIYTCQSAGWYAVAAQLAWTGTMGVGYAYNTLLYKNGSQYCYATHKSWASTTDNIYPSLTTLVYCNAGDQLSIYSQAQGGNGTYITGACILSINRLTGAAAVSAAESVNCRYTTAAGQSIGTGVTADIIFGTKDYDSHGAFNPATGVFTAPSPGKYRLTTETTVVAGSATGGAYYAFGTKNGSIHSQLGNARQVTSGAVLAVGGSATVNMLQGDQLKVQLSNSTSTGGTLDTVGYENWVTIEKVGN